MAKGEFIKRDNDIYYVDNNGYMVSACLITIKGNTYYFDAAGRLQKGQKLINGKQYFFMVDGSEIEIYNIDNFLFFSTDFWQREASDPGFGLVQWTPATKLINWAASEG